MKRDSFIFYRSFFEAINNLPEENQLPIYRAISEFSLNFDEIDLDGIEATIFILIKPQLEANNKRYLNGTKTKTKAKQKQNRSKTKANKNVNVNDNVNKNNNIPILDEFVSYALSKKSNIDVSSVQMKYHSWIENDWKDGNGKEIINWKSKLLNTIPYIKSVENSRFNESGKPKLSI